MYSVCRIWISSTATAVLAVVVFHTPFYFKVIWKIVLIQLRHFCIGRKLSFGQTTAICITPAYSDRLASGFRPTAAETFSFSAWFHLAADAVLWNSQRPQKINSTNHQAVPAHLTFGVTELISIYLHFCLCGMFLLVSPCSERRATISSGRQATVGRQCNKFRGTRLWFTASAQQTRVNAA